MELLLLSGLGPSFYNEELLAESLFDPAAADRLVLEYYNGVDLGHLAFEHEGRRRPLLRPLPGRGGVGRPSSDALLDKQAPHLTTWTLESILIAAELEHQTFDLSTVWQGGGAPRDGAFDIVLLSTTFIWHRASLAAAVAWVAKHLSGTVLVLGGQYSNLKFDQIMREYPTVNCIVRGDGEIALPTVVRALRSGGNLRGVPNLVFRESGNGRITVNPLQYVDLDSHPSPSLAGTHPIVPYESMRGCPFGCKFCSFPHASPKWRYKSAGKIRDDWAEYADRNAALHVRAYDSTFPTPPKRLRELLGLLPDVHVSWEAFARANSIKTSETVERLVAAHCRMLTFGFESMSPSTLALMNKQVRADDNRRAFDLLRAGELGYRASFMVGYPGETPEAFGETRDFLTEEYEGHFLLNVFSLMDETMPVWEDAKRLELVLDDPEDPDRYWRHAGMDLTTAKALMADALDRVRWNNDRAVHLLWQQRYERPLMPHRPPRDNLRVEKLVERLAMVPSRARTTAERRLLVLEIVGQLEREGVGALAEECP
jgi:radical SAM superfamily enzyme YgiQ (UPF0313 family)